MNRILYFLIGVSAAAVTALAFFQRHDLAKVTSTEALTAVAFPLVLAAAACALTYSRWGRKLRQRFDQKTMDGDDRTRINARTKGEVRPPLGP